jgi:hypothetical protein
MDVVGFPALGLLVLAIVASVAFAAGGQRIVHARFPAHDFVGHNEVGGFIISVAGAVYAVLLGFLTVVAWQHFTETRQVVALESAAAADAWHTAVGLPTDRRTRLRKDVLDYANTMVANEWPAMQRGGFDPNADVIVMDAFEAAGTLRPADGGQATAQSLTLQQLTTLHDMRQRRLSENESAVTWFEWVTLAIGALAVISFCWLFGLNNENVHLLMTSIVTTIIVSALVLLFELQYPFRTDLRIDAGDWQKVVAHIQMMQTGDQAEMKM